MKLSHRPMQPEDIPECVEIVANHPVIGPRYGSLIKHLPEAWLRLLQCEAKIAVVAHAEEGSRAPICFSGVSAIVQDDFLSEMKSPPHFWIGPELTRRIVRGDSPLLTSKQLREANSRGGLNLVCWESCVHPEYESHDEVPRYWMSVFIQEHRGYLWKEVTSSQCGTPEHLDFVFRTGGYLWDPLAGGYTSSLGKDASEIVRQPFVVGTTPDLEHQRGAWTASWVGALFDYHPPMLGFSGSERRLLCCALPGATDEELTGMLDISLPSVKKLWVSIYHRVEDHLPEVMSDPLQSGTPSNVRGREKRRRLLAYLREHPEEMRPYSRTTRDSRSKVQVVAP